MADQKETLTPKQLHFARCVASGMTQSAAYREAYSVSPKTKPETVNQAASRLMANSNIAARVKVLVSMREQALIRSSLSDRERVLKKLRGAIDGEPTNALELKAAELLGKSVGLFKDVIEDGSATRSAAELEAELQARLDELEQLNMASEQPAKDEMDDEAGTVH